MKLFILLIILSIATILGCVPESSSQEIGKDKTDQTNVENQAQVANSATEYESGSWVTNYDLALQYAKELKRPVLINFTGSDWCSWCIKLSKEVFTEGAFLAYAKDNLVLLKLDFPRKKQLPKAEQDINNALASDFNVEGFPTIVLVDASGKEINRTGYQPGGPEQYIIHLKGLLKPE